MIVSHALKLIFIKTKKVGGTSFEMALSAFCGPDCLITPVSPRDEAQRQALGYRGAQNYRDPAWPGYGQRTQGEFFNHLSAPVARKAMPASLWGGYRKVTIVRDPFDVAISRYYWEGGEGTGLSFPDYLRRCPGHLRENAGIAPPGGDAVLDHYLRYETLQADMAAAGLSWLWPTFDGLRAKADKRPRTGASVAEIYAAHPEAVDLVRAACAEEIAHFGYDLPAAA